MDEDWYALLAARATQMRRQETGSSSAPPPSSEPPSSSQPPPSSQAPPPPQSSSSAPPPPPPASSSAPVSSTPVSVTPTTTARTTTPPVQPITSRSVSTRSDGGIVTLTLTQTPTPSPPAPEQSKGFFQNKAAMGATFGVAGLAAIVLIFALITTCIRRRRAKRFDRDVAEAAAAAAREAEAMNPYIEQEEARMAGTNWKSPIAHQGYGKIDDDPYGYAAAGAVGAGAAGYGMQQYGHHPGVVDAYNMNDLGAAQHSMYSGHSNTMYSNGSNGASYYMNEPQQRAPSAASNPGYAGLGSGSNNPPAAYQNTYDNSNMRYRGPQQGPAFGGGPGSAEDAYGGYADDRYPNPYAAAVAATYAQAPPPVPPKSPGNAAKSIQTPSSYGTSPSAEGSTAHLTQSSPYRGARESQGSVAHGQYDPNQNRILKVANE